MLGVEKCKINFSVIDRSFYLSVDWRGGKREVEQGIKFSYFKLSGLRQGIRFFHFKLCLLDKEQVFKIIWVGGGVINTGLESLGTGIPEDRNTTVQ